MPFHNISTDYSVPILKTKHNSIDKIVVMVIHIIPIKLDEYTRFHNTIVDIINIYKRR